MRRYNGTWDTGTLRGGGKEWSELYQRGARRGWLRVEIARERVDEVQLEFLKTRFGVGEEEKPRVMCYPTPVPNDATNESHADVAPRHRALPGFHLCEPRCNGPGMWASKNSSRGRDRRGRGALAPQGCSSFQSRASRCDHALRIVPTVEALEEALGLGLMSALMTLAAALSLPSCSCVARDHVLAVDESDLALLDRPYVSGVGSDTAWIWLGGWCSGAAWGSTLRTARAPGALSHIPAQPVGAVTPQRRTEDVARASFCGSSLGAVGVDSAGGSSGGCARLWSLTCGVMSRSKVLSRAAGDDEQRCPGSASGHEKAVTGHAGYTKRYIRGIQEALYDKTSLQINKSNNLIHSRLDLKGPISVMGHAGYTARGLGLREAVENLSYEVKARVQSTEQSEVFKQIPRIRRSDKKQESYSIREFDVHKHHYRAPPQDPDNTLGSQIPVRTKFRRFGP
ncbi:hypothetical protein B0H10DRAFT_2201377 [Mycena sp. CBHHK59/15]|nr:hypothetical protein B0H10DRAFT_2201377 [Mycena sp. CBHHK59/15]